MRKTAIVLLVLMLGIGSAAQASQKVRGEMMKEIKRERIDASKRTRLMRTDLKLRKKQRAGELKGKYRRLMKETSNHTQKRQIGNELRAELKRLRMEYRKTKKEEAEKLKRIKQHNIEKIRSKYAG